MAIAGRAKVRSRSDFSFLNCSPTKSELTSEARMNQRILLALLRRINLCGHCVLHAHIEDIGEVCANLRHLFAVLEIGATALKNNIRLLWRVNSVIRV